MSSESSEYGLCLAYSGDIRSVSSPSSNNTYVDPNNSDTGLLFHVRLHVLCTG